MSSPSETSYRPDDSANDDSDFAPSDRGQQQQSPSSRAENFDIEYTTVQDSIEPENQSEEADEDEPNSSQSRWERLNALFQYVNSSSLDNYIKILEEDHGDLAVEKPHEAPFVGSQNGAVSWSSWEKGVMYNALDRLGKNGVEKIAALIGTKSALEVADYLKSLQRDLAEKQNTDLRNKNIIMGDIPAAVEVSRECCKELDKYAAAAVLQEDVELERKSRLQFVDNALISDLQANNILAMEGNPLPGSLHLAGNLLNVPTWTRLSGLFFMNFGGTRAEDCWHNLVQSKKERPSIYAETLMDFYALAMSITRRLIQSSIFFALARLRGLSSMGRIRRQAVRKRDVKAALDVLNMKQNRAGFFLGVVRRNQLAIVDDSNRNDHRPLSYDEAEEMLQSRKSANEPESDIEDSPSESEKEIVDSTTEARQSHLPSASDTDAPSDSHSYKQPPPKVAWNKIPLDPEEEHADLIDLEASRCEELKMWGLLGTPAPSHLNAPGLSYPKPRNKLKSPEELADWRDRILYRSEWEEYGDGTRDLQKDLVANRRKRRLSSYEAETESEVGVEVERPRRRRKARKPRKKVGEPKSRAAIDQASSDEESEDEELDYYAEDQEMETDGHQDPTEVDEEDRVEDDDRMDMDERPSPTRDIVDITET